MQDDCASAPQGHPWRKATVVASLALLVGTAALPALAQGGISSEGVDPRRQGNTSKVASEIVTQEPTSNVGNDESRVDDAYQPKGIELGQFLLLPDISVGEAYNSNIYAAQTDPRGDFITRIAPTFKLRSRFNRHMLNFSGDFEQLFYEAHDDDDQFNGRLATDGRYDIGSDSEVSASIAGFRQHEDRASPDAVNGLEPTPYNGIDGKLTGKTVMGRWALTLGGAHQTYDYESVATSAGTKISNDGRDRSENKVTGRAAYEMFPGYFAVAEASTNWRDYRESINAGGVDRSSNGYAGEAGVGVDLSRLIRGDFLVGYFKQDYDAASLQDPSGMSFHSVINWTPSRLTLVVASLKREVVETTNTVASSIVRNGTSLMVRHELQRNIILTALGRFDLDQYEGIDGSSRSYEGKGSATYAFNENVYTTGELGYRRRDAVSNVTNSFDQVVASVRLGFRM
ncbi:MAG: outer membrane beta-barrel protein [Alphaproteobacteria bacterium]